MNSSHEPRRISVKISGKNASFEYFIVPIYHKNIIKPAPDLLIIALSKKKEYNSKILPYQRGYFQNQLRSAV
jgi:hypothetical protein